MLQGYADGRAAAQWDVHRGIWARGGVPEGTAERAGQRGVPGEPPGPTLCQAGAATCRNHPQSVPIKRRLLSLSLSSLGTSGATERPALLIMRGSPELLEVAGCQEGWSQPDMWLLSIQAFRSLHWSRLCVSAASRACGSTCRAQAQRSDQRVCADPVMWLVFSITL